MHGGGAKYMLLQLGVCRSMGVHTNDTYGTLCPSIFPILYSIPYYTSSSTILSNQTMTAYSERGSVSRLASSTTGFAGTQTGLTTWLANGRRHRASIYYHFSYILFACSGARLVDPARDMFQGRHGIAWHGIVGWSHSYDYDGLCCILRFSIYPILVTRDQSYPPFTE